MTKDTRAKMKRRKYIVTEIEGSLITALLLLGAWPLEATTILQESFAQRIAASDLVCAVTIDQTRAAPDGRPATLHTVTQLEEDCIKGHEAKQFTVITPGLSTEKRSIRVPGFSGLELHKPYVLYLEKGEEPHVYLIRGLSEGMQRLENDSTSGHYLIRQGQKPTELSALRQKIRRMMKLPKP